jgi:hypothetical protein
MPNNLRSKDFDSDFNEMEYYMYDKEIIWQKIDSKI